MEPKSVWSGTFTLFGVEVRCHVLNDGRRVIEEESVRRLLEAMAERPEPGEMGAFYRWMQGGTDAVDANTGRPG